MKARALIFPILLWLVIPLVGVAQEGDGGAYGVWKRNFAAPSYGLALFGATIRQEGIMNVDSSFDREDFLVPAVDLRIFKGINVSRRGGFYTGVEVGAFIYIPNKKEFHDSVIVHDFEVPFDWVRDYDFNAEVYGGTVFLMMKYGLRIDLGISLLGISAGFELGAGASLHAGGYKVFNDLAEVEWGSDETAINLIVEPSAEATMRLGRNFRLFVKGGLVIMPPVFVHKDKPEPFIFGDGAMINRDEEYMEYALNNYEIELDTIGYDVRIGFALNFN